MTARRRRTPSSAGRGGSSAKGGPGRSRGAGRGGSAKAGRGQGGKASRGHAASARGKRGADAREPRRRSVVGSIPVEIGRVVHVYPRAGAAVVALTGELRAGDAVAVRGATTDFCALAERLERDGEPVASAASGEAVGVALPHRVREGDRVFRLSR